MISVEEALNKIKRRIPKKNAKWIGLSEALGYVLAEDIHSQIELPVFDNSAMDGFVLKSGDTRKGTKKNPIRLNIMGDIRAGETKKVGLKEGQSYRIMTGACIPIGADTVVAKEEAVVDGNELLFFSPVTKGKHVRRKGEELSRGERVLKKGTVIHPGTVGFLASLGRDKVKVYAKPRVSVVVTGSELVKPGLRLKHGQIYESNSWMLLAALNEMGILPFRIKKVRDNPASLRKAMQALLKESDILILTGGVSVGEFDYVKMILGEFGVKQIFWRVKQKPGKPIYFGKSKGTLVFGLPGNPASVFTCFYKYVYPAIRWISGRTNGELESERIPISDAVSGDLKRTRLLKSQARMIAGKKQAAILKHQGSHMLSSLCESNALIVLPPSRRAIRKGSRVHVDFLPLRGGM